MKMLLGSGERGRSFEKLRMSQVQWDNGRARD
jgi:hypothetical protein